MRACKKCLVPKPSADFDIHSESGKLRGVCRGCRSAQSKERYVKNRVEVLAKNKRYHENHREELRAYRKSRYVKNKGRKTAYNRAYYQINRLELLRLGKKYYESHREMKRDYKKEYWSKNRERASAQNRDKNYGLSPGEFDTLVSKQGGTCAICNKVSKKKLCVDHCHDSGKVRGLLCFKCNFAIGQLDDSSERALSAYNYLKRHGK